MGDLNISEVVQLPAARAAEFFASKKTKVKAAAAIAEHMTESGLGYVRIGQPLTSLSGGERQRLKLAMSLIK